MAILSGRRQTNLSGIKVMARVLDWFMWTSGLLKDLLKIPVSGSGSF